MQTPTVAAPLGAPDRDTLDVAAETTVNAPLAKGRVSRVNLNEEHIEDVDRDEDGVFVEARRNEIVTLRFRWE